MVKLVRARRAAILDNHDRAAFASLRSLTVGEFREFLLDDATTGERLKALQRAITPEVAAAVAKLMGNKELVYVASKIRNVTRCRNTMGERGVFGVRVQPNHPADDLAGILVSAVDGLSFGCGDAVIGVNPDRRESDLAPMSQDLLDLWRGSSGSEPSAAHAASGEPQSEPISLWWYVMLLALLVLVTETGLASRYMGTLREEP